ncbi:hypothetical protein KS4_07570 [Poriferisphaera corsica]|uniref:Lipoprotein n=1 Tax=Poriferisphaera corsica TaxID=2528020 RepID=A0A517YR66_9BACT|nr:DUF6607 family protein [Poriferisphaera corsica]QDU32723.1 hypothetical protein KS4_07570 [Poriferisphaera corsica]
MFYKSIIPLCLLALLVGCATSTPTNTSPSSPPSTQSKFQLDRQAILAMAGEFDVSFKFHETLSRIPDYQLEEPYTSKATEYVFVVEDTSSFISLQHILVMYFEDSDQPIITKHWRQDWQYQDTKLTTYIGYRNFQTSEIYDNESKGQWSQAVYQVDDSPRYEALGQWTHLGNQSSWQSQDTWRTLPRREYSNRSDYDVLLAKNRHTITPDGWVHEQDNQKLVLDDTGQPLEVISHEIGINTYTRTNQTDFTPGRLYWDNTKAFWADVRNAWHNKLKQPRTYKITKKVDNKSVASEMLKIANDIHKSNSYTQSHKDQANELIHAAITPLTFTNSN